MTGKRTFAILTVALLAATLPAAHLAARVAIVADVDPDNGVGLGVAPACTDSCPGPGAIMLQALPTTSAELQTIAHVEKGLPVRVVELDPAVKAEARAIAQASADDPADIKRLRAAISASGQLKSELTANAVPVQSVMAASLAGNGGLILFAKGPPPHNEPMISLLKPNTMRSPR